MKKKVLLLITILVMFSSFAFADMIGIFEPWIKDLGIMTIVGVLGLFVVINIIISIANSFSKKHVAKNHFIIKTILTLAISIAAYLLIKNSLSEELKNIINANKESAYALCGIGAILTIAIYKLFGIIECVITGETVRPSDSLYMILFLLLFVVAISATIWIRYNNSSKLDDSLKYLTNAIKMKDKIELREDIVNMTLYGDPINANYNHINDPKTEYDSTTLVGSGYAIKSDGTVILDKSKAEVYKIETFPADGKTNKLLWWFMHSFLW